MSARTYNRDLQTVNQLRKTCAEFVELLKVLNKSNHKFKNIILLELYTGMRIGEILALTTDDINFESGTIIINKTLTKDLNIKLF